ncbi:unnamed protein product [Cylicocyclus nassatus]|uniref:RING-type domain-containing protein n=1 Tax=Cylicocyclus nassatus TaxID=53992 RepID=A0AA36GJ20_CYLNA|nr:unnamed protein product [Cylicocyclus nassatus]
MTLGTTLLIDVQKLVECPICRENFVDPLQLSCGHTFCKSCLDKLPTAQTSKSANDCDPFVRCPECRQDTRLPLSSLPINYRLRDMAALFSSSSTSASATHADSKKRKYYWICSICGDVSTNGVFMSCCDCAVDDKQALQMCPVCCLVYHNGHNILKLMEGSTLPASPIADMKPSHQKHSSQQPSDVAGSAFSESTSDFQQGQPQVTSAMEMDRTISNGEVETYTIQERREDTMIEVEHISANMTFGARPRSENAIRLLPAAIERAKKYCDCKMLTVFVIGLQYFACFILLVLLRFGVI